ncbi:TPA: hypothetical protein ACNTUM_000887, partial [Escherichia coli]
RNFMRAVKDGCMTEDEINADLNEIHGRLENLRINAIAEINKMNGCHHEFGKAKGSTQIMVMGNPRDSWERGCIHCGMVERFSCMQESNEPRPAWTDGAKMTFIPRF